MKFIQSCLFLPKEIQENKQLELKKTVMAIEYSQTQNNNRIEINNAITIDDTTQDTAIETTVNNVTNNVQRNNYSDIVL